MTKNDHSEPASWDTNLPAVPVALLVLHFHVHGCGSLKEKRSRLSGLRSRFGKSTSVAVCESAYQNSHTEAQWSFVATGADPALVSRSLQEIENYAAAFVDAELLSAQTFSLN